MHMKMMYCLACGFAVILDNVYAVAVKCFLYSSSYLYGCLKYLSYSLIVSRKRILIVILGKDKRMSLARRTKIQYRPELDRKSVV